MLNRTRKGMTLLELIVVIVILGILAAIAIPTFASIIDKSHQQSASTTAAAIGDDATALAAFDQVGWADGSGSYMTTAASEASDAGTPTVTVTPGVGSAPATAVATVTITTGGASYCATLSGDDVDGTAPSVSVADGSC